MRNLLHAALFTSTLLLVAAGIGCRYTGGPARGSNPRPSTHLAHHDQRLSLLLPTELRSDFHANPKWEVHDFVGTVTRGFFAGFEDSYGIVDDHADRYLELTSIEIWFSPEANRSLWVTNIRFHARLLDENRKELARYATTVHSKVAGQDGTILVGSAVEAMYEEVADKLLYPLEKPAN